MSYGFGVVVNRGDDVAAALDAGLRGPAFGIEGNPSPLFGQEQHGTADECVAAVASAAVAAEAILGGLGPNWAAAGVSVSGHCNRGNAKDPGWANDCIQVNISVDSYKEPQ